MRWWIALLLIGALAGCADASEPTSDDPLQGLDAKTTSTTGAITGVVVTDSLVPIAGANVSVAQGEMAMVTGEDGIFRFEDVAPGVYFVQVSAPDHLATHSSAEVIAGQVAKLRILLAPDPTPKPYFATNAFDGYAEAWVGIAGWAYDILVADITGVYACQECRFNFTAGDGLETIVMEAQWKETLDPGPAEPLLTGYYLSFYDSEGLVDTWYVDPGEAIHLQAGSFAAGDEFEVSLYPDDVWPGIQQSYELFVTTFHYSPAPDGWSLIAGDGE